MAKMIQSKPLYQQVVDHIKDGIARGIYPKDELLPSERVLMEGLGVGRVTVREGLRILSEAGVIRTVKGKGSFVAVSWQDLQNDPEQEEFRRHFRESTQLRLLLEPSVAREVALHANDEELRAIRDSMTADGVHPENFHTTVIKALHNEALEELFGRLGELENSPVQYNNTLVQPVAQEGTLHTFQEQHVQIYEAIARRDGDAAFTLMRRHLEYVQKTYENYFGILCS